MMHDEQAFLDVMEAMSRRQGTTTTTKTTPRKSDGKTKESERDDEDDRGEKRKDDAASPVVAVASPATELTRRRCFERFKASAVAAIRDAANGATDEDDARAWRALPHHSILEQWHLCVKTLENQRRRRRRRARDPVASSSSSSSSSPDPLLLSSRAHRDGASVDDDDDDDAARTALLRSQTSFFWDRERRKRRRPTSTTGTTDLPSSLREIVDGPLSRRLRRIVEETDDEFRRRRATAARAGAGAGAGRPPKIATDVVRPSAGDDDVPQVSVTYGGLTLWCNREHFDDLRTSYRGPCFPSALFCLLCRYDALAGAGSQSAVPGPVLGLLRERFGCRAECFASPLNRDRRGRRERRRPRYCSAFPDVDAPFGSEGDFFSVVENDDLFFAVEGEGDEEPSRSGVCLQANPPFAAEFVKQMVEAMERRLTRHASSSTPLLFVVVVPEWRRDAVGHGRLVASPRNVRDRIVLDQKETPHHYFEGTQHRRTKTRHRVSSFDTAVFFLGNDAARTRWFSPRRDDDDLEEELARAFRVRDDGSEEQRTTTTTSTANRPVRVGPTSSSGPIDDEEGDAESSSFATRRDGDGDREERKEVGSATRPRKKRRKNGAKRARNGLPKTPSDERERQMRLLTQLGLGGGGGGGGSSTDDAKERITSTAAAAGPETVRRKKRPKGKPKKGRSG